MVKGQAVKKVLGLQYLQCSPLGPSPERHVTLTSSIGNEQQLKRVGWGAGEVKDMFLFIFFPALL